MRPKAFISSTIYDFADLRGAIKYYLEVMGCDVLASEYNDFTGGVSQNSYKACVDAIGQCQFFVLLIGKRVGGRYIDGNSITRCEYREAYELAKMGRIKIITLIRKDVMAAIAERRDIAQFLADSEEVDRESALKDAPSRFLNDSKHIEGFVAEVKRVDDFKLAAGDPEKLPANNWIYVFENFRDVVDVLKGQIGIKSNFSELYMLQRTEEEVLGNLNMLLEKRKGSIGSMMDMFYNANAKYKVSPTEDMDMENIDIARLVMGTMMVVPRLKNIKSHHLSQFINQPSNYFYDHQSGRFNKPNWIKYCEALLSAAESGVTMASNFNIGRITERFIDEMRLGRGSSKVKGMDVWDIIIIPSVYDSLILGYKTILLHLRGKKEISTEVFPSIMGSLDMNSDVFRQTDGLMDVEAYLAL